MRVEPLDDAWVVVMNNAPSRYFCIIDGAGGWSKHRSLAKLFDTKDGASAKATRLREKAKTHRERGLLRKPKPLAEYVWTPDAKKMLVEMARIGCSYPAMAVQTGRTAAACSAMYNLLQQQDAAAMASAVQRLVSLRRNDKFGTQEFSDALDELACAADKWL